MKKTLLILTGLIVVAVINAQTLDEIVKSYSATMKTDNLANVKTIKISGKMSAMGMEMPMVMFMKNPNKIKVTYNFNGQEMVSVYDGEKGYTMNPMTGSSDPIELKGEALKQIQKNSLFNNELMRYFKGGFLTLEGQENVNEKPAYKLKATEGTNPVYMYIDKATYMLVKSSATVEQMGNSMNMDSYMSDYVNIEGVILPKKTTLMANGMEGGVISFDKIEVNIPMEDSIFKIK
jgi:hypothetical protein